MDTVFEATPEKRKENTISLMHEELRNGSETSTDIPGIPLAPSIKNSKPGVIFVLEKASLVPAYVARTYEILNPDKHEDSMRKKNMNPYDYRPDIIHEVLVDILGRRLNMAAQLLQKFSIKARGKGEKLMRLIENSLKIGLSFSSSKAVNLRDYVTTIDNDCTLVFIIGSMAHGKIDSEHTNDLISVSSLPLSSFLTSIKCWCLYETYMLRIGEAVGNTMIRGVIITNVQLATRISVLSKSTTLTCPN